MHFKQLQATLMGLDEHLKRKYIQIINFQTEYNRGLQ